MCWNCFYTLLIDNNLVCMVSYIKKIKCASLKSCIRQSTARSQCKPLYVRVACCVWYGARDVRPADNRIQAAAAAAGATRGMRTRDSYSDCNHSALSFLLQTPGLLHTACSLVSGLQCSVQQTFQTGLHVTSTDNSTANSLFIVVLHRCIQQVS